MSVLPIVVWVLGGSVLLWRRAVILSAERRAAPRLKERN
jgi:hypothetical protein